MLLTKEQLDKSSVLLPEIGEHLASMPKPPPDANLIDMIRQGLKAMSAGVMAMIGPAPEGISETYEDIPMRDGYMSSIKIQKPSKSTAGPLVTLVYGGGFIGGDNNQLSQVGRALVALFGATVVSTSYRHAPEFRSPVQTYDTWDSMKWIAENSSGPLLAADPSKGFVMGGASAGACLTAVLSRKFQEDKLAHPLTGQWLGAAPLMNMDTCPDKFKQYYISLEQNSDNPLMSKERFQQLTALSGWDMNSDLRNASKSKTPLSGQPKTYTQVEGVDILRDDMLIYDEMLKEAGVATKVDFYDGCIHCTMFQMMGTELGNKITIDAIVGFAWLLDRTMSREDAAAALGIK